MLSENILILRPSPAPVFDSLQYTKMLKEGLVDLITLNDIR